MAYGRPANIRSHRRGGKRRRQVKRRLSLTLVGVLAVTGMVVGYTQVLARTCSGEEMLQVYASAATAAHLTAFANEWVRGEPATEDGTCARVTVESRDSSQVAAELGGSDPADAAEGTGLPDVWVPASTIWVHRAAASEAAAPLLPELAPSIARTPAVIAMPAPMAEALDWPQTRVDPDEEVRWGSLLAEFGDGEEGWARFDRPEWGDFRFGMANPARDTAGLLALTAILSSTADGPQEDEDTGPEELADAYPLSRLLEREVYHETTEQLLNRLSQADEEGEDTVLRHVSAFPALETEVLAYNRANPTVPLAAIYPVDGTVEADHPYLTLTGDWVTPGKREVAEGFLAHLRSDGPQAVLREAGFRGSDREPGADLVEQNGLQSELVALPRAVPQPQSVTLVIDRWTALTKRLNVLMVLDVSGLMLQEVPGTGEIRLDRAKAAATGVVELFSDDDQVGFWEFSAALDGDLDYRVLVPLGRLDDTMDDGRDRRNRILGVIESREPVAGAGLHITIQAAYDAVLANYDEDAVNMVVVVSHGVDDTGGQTGLSFDDLLNHLRGASADGQQVRIASVTLGEESDFAAVAEISDLTGGAAYYSDDGLDLSELLRAAVFDSVS